MNDVTEQVNDLLQDINDTVVFTIAERLRKIGKLNRVDVAKAINILRFYNEDLRSLEEKLADITDITIKEVDKMLRESAEEAGMETAAQFDRKYTGSGAIDDIVLAASAAVTEDILNISRTSVMLIDGKPLKEAYTEAINRAILAVTTGVKDYNTAIRDVLMDLSDGVTVKYKGNRVNYASGKTRRLDSAIRMNILDGMRKMNHDVRKAQGQEFGATGVYIMPHALCAPDHLPYQGMEYTYEEFEDLNNKLVANSQRPIATGSYNCGHIAYDRVVGDPLPYDIEELAELNSYAGEMVTWNDKPMTRYEASQKMRAAETRIRELKNKRKFFKKYGDSLEEERYNKYIAKARKKYFARCQECGLRPHSDLL